MKMILLCLAMGLGVSTAYAKELTVKLDGKKVKVSYSMINHEIKETDKVKGDQTSAMACSFLIFNLLANGDIQGMSKFSTDPAKCIEKWTHYIERVGLDYFKQMMSDYFTSKNVIMAEFVIGNERMLVIKTEIIQMGQFYLKKDGKYLEIEEAAAGKTFGHILNLIQEDKLKL
jgi:hypothetical protein